MRFFSAVSLGLCLATYLAQAARWQPCDVAAPRLGADGQLDPYFRAMHESFMKRKSEGPIGLLFIGDSITAGWVSAPDTWQRHFGRYNPANFGVGGDQTQNVLWRIENGELDGLQPKVVVLMIGTNNILYPLHDILSGLSKVIWEIRTKLPGSKLLLLAILPRADAGISRYRDIVNNNTRDVNATLAKLDDKNKTRFLDVGGPFLDANGALLPGTMLDGLHPSPKGYEIWANALQPLLDEMMK